MAGILIVDGNANLVEAVTHSLRAKGHTVIGVHGGSQAIRSLRDVIVHLMVLDALTCFREGAEVCQMLGKLARLNGVPVLLLTHPGQGEEAYLELLDVGAGASLAKPFEISALEEHVTTLLEGIHKGAHRAYPGSLKVGFLVLDPHTFKVHIDDRDVSLTPIEFSLLRYLMEHAGEVVSSETLLQDVWKFPHNAGSPEVVRTHIGNLRTKIGPSGGSSQIIQTIPRHGYTIPLEPGGSENTTTI